MEPFISKDVFFSKGLNINEIVAFVATLVLAYWSLKLGKQKKLTH